MSKAEIERFVSDMKTNNKLREDLKAAQIDEAGIVGFAASKGYDITAAEVKSHLSAKLPHLSDEELDQVAGGHHHHGWTAVKHNVVQTVEGVTTEVTVTETTAAQDAELTTTVAAVAELVAT